MERPRKLFKVLICNFQVLKICKKGYIEMKKKCPRLLHFLLLESLPNWSKKAKKVRSMENKEEATTELMTWTVILPMFLRVMKNDFIVSRFLKAINKLKYNNSIFSFYSSVCVLLFSFTVRKIFTSYFFVLTDFAICCFFFRIHI